MTYIELINHFWQIRRTIDFSHTEADFYFMLLQEANLRFWVNPVPISTRTMTLNLNMTNKMVVETRNKLKQKGMIDFSEGKRRSDVPSYTILFPLVSTGNQNGNQNGNHIREDLRQETEEEEEKKEKNEKKKTVFKPPSLDECRKHFIVELEPDYGSATAVNEADKFFNFYESKGWYVGKNKMKSWAGAAGGWIARNKTNFNNGGGNGKNNGGNRSATSDRGGSPSELADNARKWENLRTGKQSTTRPVLSLGGGTDT